MSRNIPLTTSSLGFPRIGSNRELKFALESFWKGRTSEDSLLAVARSLRERHWNLQKAAGITTIPSNDFSLYDQVLDALVLVGATPERFGNQEYSLTQYFSMARNSREQTAMEMTKWFDTNYHYLVPGMERGTCAETKYGQTAHRASGGTGARHPNAPGSDWTGNTAAARQTGPQLRHDALAAEADSGIPAGSCRTTLRGCH